MAYNKLNPLEKEMLIRLYRRNPNTTMSEFCAANNVSAGAFKNWMKKYDEGGPAAPCRTKEEASLLPGGGVDESEENLRRERIRTGTNTGEPPPAGMLSALCVSGRWAMRTQGFR